MRIEYTVLFAAIIASSALSITSSLFGKKNNDLENVSFLYSLIVTLSATIMWGIVCLFNEEFCYDILAYSFCYGVFYTFAMVGMFKAYQLGPVSLTAFVKQISLIIVSFWGFLFWGNDLTVNIAIGLALVVIALYLCFKPDNAGTKKTPLKFYIFAIMLLVGNAGCSITQKYQQMAYGGKCDNSFMFYGSIISFAVSLVLYLKNPICRSSKIAKHTVIYPVAGGMSSAILNLLILHLLSSNLSESIIFPGIAIGGLLFTIVFSFVVYRERFRFLQWCGLLLGIVSLVFLNVS